jgi:hypothetical protein
MNFEVLLEIKRNLKMIIESLILDNDISPKFSNKYNSKF